MSDRSQREAIRETEWDWLVIADAGRYDVLTEFEDLPWAAGDVERVYNGGVGYTATWMKRTFSGTYDGLFVHGGQPIYSMKGDDYDERDHFATVPEYTDFEWDGELNTCPPAAVVAVVRERLADHDGGVIRFLQPHPPFREMPERTRGRSNRMQRTARAVQSGDLSYADVRAAYRDNFAWVLEEGIEPLLGDLEGTVVVTADHGECLGECGQWFHGGGYDEHDHLVNVPWVVIE